MGSHIFVLFLIAYDRLLDFKDTHMKMDHNLTSINSMTLPKHVASQRRTESKCIIMMLLVETNLVLSKAIQNHEADFFQGLLRNKDTKISPEL